MNKSKTFGRVTVLGATIISMLAPVMAHAALETGKLASVPVPVTPSRALSGAQGQAPAGTTPVSPGADAAWTFNSEGLGGPGTVSNSSFQGYGLAPAGGPAGVGALHQRIGANADGLQYGTHLAAGRHLGSISELSFSTYLSPNGPGNDISPALQLTLDLDGDGLYTGFTTDDILIFEPHHQRADRPMLEASDVVPTQCGDPCIVEGAWKTWDARGGAWYSRRGDGVNRWNGINFESIEHYLARYPSATIATNPASLSFRSGSGWSNVENYLDALKIDGTTFDFEPTIQSVTPRTPDWRFQTSFSGTEEFVAKWSDNGSRIGTVDGPSFTGTGSSQQIISPSGNNDHVSYGTTAMAGTRLDELNDLSYATFVETGSVRPPVLSLRIDLNGDGVWQNNDVDDTLQYLAGNQSTPALTNTWQFWSTLTGQWYSRNNDLVKPMSAWITATPNAKIALSDASIMVSLGTGYSNVRAYADSISVNGKLFDIETADQLVSPADGAGGWYYNPPLSSEGTSGDRQALVTGPDGSPAGVGSLSQRTSATKLAATTPLYAGKRLRDLTSLSYWTYRKTSSSQMPALKIHLDLDGDMGYTSSATDAVLVFEPAYQHSGYVTPGQGTLLTNTWQRWDATEGGWYVAGRTLAGPCTAGTTGPPVCKLADIINTRSTPGGVKYGDLIVPLGPNSIDIQVSSSGSPDVFSDRLTVNGTTFNFEASVPTPLPATVDGNRSSDEGYRLLATDTTTTGGPLDLSIYGTCSATDNYLYVESTNSDVSTLNLFFDVNQNDVYNGAPSDRQASIDNTGVRDASSAQAIPNAGSQRSFDGKGYEIQIPRAYNSGGWINYDVWNSDSVRNTGWSNTDYASMKMFLPEPCTYIPTFVNGSVAIDCDRTTSDIRLIQHLLDRGLGNSVKLHGTCDVSATGPHGGDQVKVAAAAFAVDRDGVTIESLDPTNKAKIVGSGTQAGFYVAPGSKDVTIRSLWMQGLSRGVVVQNSIRTTVGYKPPGTQLISPFGNRIIGVGNLQEGILAVGAGNGMGNGAAAEVSVTQGNLQGGVRKYSIAGVNAEDLKDVTIAGNYISYSPSGPLTTTSDVTGIVVRQNGTNRDVFGVNVSQNAVGMASSDFPSFNYAGIRVHSDSNDPVFAHIKDVVVFKNSLGRLEELNLTEAGLPDAGDLQATGRTGIAIGRVQNFVVQGNSIRTVLSAVPGVNMIGGGIVVYDSFDGNIETNSIITIAGPDTEDEDLGAIGIVDDLMNAFNAAGASGKPTANITIVSNYAGWATSDSTTVGTQRGIVINGASKISTALNQMKMTGAESLLISIPISGAGQALGGPAVMPALPVKLSTLCTNWLETYRNSGKPQDKPLAEVRFGGRTNGSTGNVFPGGSSQGTGNSSC